jgi:hypothetical protein
MRYKLILALSLAFVALAPLAAPVKPVEARTGPVVGISCERIAYGRQLCQADVIGGTAPYTYEWGPPPLTGTGQIKTVPCSGNGTRPVSVTVTDANGEIGYYSTTIQCCSSCGLQ